MRKPKSSSVINCGNARSGANKRFRLLEKPMPFAKKWALEHGDSRVCSDFVACVEDYVLDEMKVRETLQSIFMCSYL